MPASTEGICAGGPLKCPPEKIGTNTFCAGGNFCGPRAQSITKILHCFFSRQLSLCTVPEKSSDTAPKSQNIRRKVLFLNSLEEVTLKGKFVPYLAFFQV